MSGRAGPERRGPERPGPDYPPEWDNEPGSRYPAPSSPVALLDQLDELRANATPGPWEVEEDWIWAGLTGGGAFGELVTRAADLEDADAALIVAAVNAVGPLTAAVRAVLALHRPVGGPSHYDGDESGYCEYDGFIWPCSEYRAITAALSVTP